MSDVKLLKGTAKNEYNNEQVDSLRDANDILSQCCGIRCCPGQEALRLTDRTTGITHELFFDNGIMYRRIFDAAGNIVSTTAI